MSSIPPAPFAPQGRKLVLGPQRQKITQACEECRRRKAKCSGLAPCDFCQKKAFHCQFVNVRHRRGPRAKTQSLISGALSNGGAPAEALVKEPVKSKPASTTSHVPPPVPQPSEATTLTFREAGQGQWLKVLRRMKADNEMPGLGDSEEFLRLQCHLIEIFFTHVNIQQTTILDRDYFFRSLVRGDCSYSLINAVCGASVTMSRHRALVSPRSTNLRMAFTSAARSQMTNGIVQSRSIYRLQTLCVLIACEFAIGNGGQAWCGIGAARNLLQLVTLGDPHPQDEVNVLKVAAAHLLVSERLHCLGYPNLLPSRQLDSVDILSLGDAWRVAFELFDLLIHIQRSASTWANQLDKPPWMSSSEFMVTLYKLERYMVQECDILHFNSKALYLKLKMKNCADPHILCSLAWHYCMLLLNRPFLPIPRLAEDSTTNSEPKLKGVINFPNAPKAFVAERIRMCESSALVICNISRLVIQSEVLFMPPFLGYCCFQSSVVMVNQLRCLEGGDSELVENLKINLSILGAMKLFYKCSVAWTEMLFYLNRADSVHVYKEAPSSTDMFMTYFSRFKDAKEPPYSGLHVIKEYPLIPTTTNATTAVRTSTNSHQKEREAEIAVSDHWMAEYEECLVGQLDVLEDGKRSSYSRELEDSVTDTSGTKELGGQALWQRPLHLQNLEHDGSDTMSHDSVLGQYNRQDNSLCYPPDGVIDAPLPVGSAMTLRSEPGDANHSQSQIIFSADGDLDSDSFMALSFDDLNIEMYAEAGERMFQQTVGEGGFELSMASMDWGTIGPHVLSCDQP